VWFEKKLPADSLRVLSGDYSVESGYRLTREILDQAVSGRLPFNALFASNDLMAVGALRALKEKGISVPTQVEVIGFDDIELAHLVEPPLSTVSQPALDMGARSAEMLLKLIDGITPRPKTRVMMPTLVLRGTTRAPLEVKA
jgi:DNA-binding LacI/PurR family transcriptional regulator